jgi:hypothetical protein
MDTAPARTIFIVSRRHFDLYTYLRERFATDPAVAVILDRRLTQSTGQITDGDRRRRPEVEIELESRSHAILTLPAPE